MMLSLLLLMLRISSFSPNMGIWGWCPHTYKTNPVAIYMGLDVSSHYPPGAPLPPTSHLIAKLWRSGRLSALVDPQGLREALVDKNVYGRIRPADFRDADSPFGLY